MTRSILPLHESRTQKVFRPNHLPCPPLPLHPSFQPFVCFVHSSRDPNVTLLSVTDWSWFRAVSSSRQPCSGAQRPGGRPREEAVRQGRGGGSVLGGGSAVPPGGEQESARPQALQQAAVQEGVGRPRRKSVDGYPNGGWQGKLHQHRKGWSVKSHCHERSSNDPRPRNPELRSSGLLSQASLSLPSLSMRVRCTGTFLLFDRLVSSAR